LTRSQVDKLGLRLRSADDPSEDDLIALDDYRLTFSEPCARVVDFLRIALGVTPTSRPGKSTHSVRYKIQRENTKLSRMQDIAGCRLVVTSLKRQNECIGETISLFAGSKQVDRRGTPSFGYRAVHVIVPIDDHRVVEVQVRTELQQAWAELSEKLADRFGPGIKYGRGPQPYQKMLLELSRYVWRVESSTTKNKLGQIQQEVREQISRYYQLMPKVAVRKRVL
jgi:ppGpp synthetase/RelA/SpoT-type nucleotidyltranferase